jgi:hypothetical protein
MRFVGMGRYLAVLWVLLLSLGLSLTGVAPAQAAYCQTLDGHKICIVAIKRSANRYWEYQSTVSIDGQPQPSQVYDCRSRVIVEPDGTIFSFYRNDPGTVVCSLYRERSKSLQLFDLKAPPQAPLPKAPTQ